MSALSLDAIDDLEMQLQRTLRRVDPNPVFVNRLQNRLVEPRFEVEKSADTVFVPVALIMGVVFGLLIFLITRLFRQG
ncbi:MAG: hypothetical protein HY835_03675 [Anaerolineae bacterium]|nr:hypothetical protein [Anaerolineae bacterium]